ncbi:KAT8 regulatory NSL complex subunit 1 isoform X1 [Anguilla rostrata]|uniref:KAT8 regulatory NSL complex subunit 1 isoform X1 n=1 Tax=Anguilla rostrata TaxID=7938 RepID=UPI0030D62ADE
MAAMAPALTDAPAEAHHLRFRLAPPSSTLSPGSVENNSNASNILLSGSGAAKRGKALGTKAEPELAEAPPAHLGKLQPLVASYLCSDVTSVPSTKESLKLQGVLIKQAVLKTHGVLPDSYFNSGDFLPRKAPGEQLKAAMSGGQPAAPPTAPPALNGLAKKLAKPGADRDRTAAVNGDRPPAGRAPPPQAPPPRGDPGALLKGGAEQPQPEDASRKPVALATSLELGGRDAQCSALPPAADGAPARSPLPGLDEEVRERTAARRARQCEMEGRLRRLRKRLQVVQAKQVERHVQQQLRSLLQSALCPPRPAGSFLRGGSVPGELDRLALSGTAGLRAAETAFDSDATESSSGGESDVEEDQLAQADLERRHVSLWRRAEGRFALERASIISHWNWLQAHISDLEYRIRQETDIYRQLRSNKGLIVLGDSAPCEVSLEDGTEVKAEPIPCHVTQERVVGGAECADADSGLWKGWAPGRPVNGVLNSLLPSLPVTGSPESSDTEEQLSKKQRGLHPCSSSSSSSSAQDASCVAARTRPVLSCKKRRLVRPNAVSNLNRKAQRTPGPRCGCDVSPSCLMCGGRGALTGDLQYERPLLDRLSQSDPCVHPILSFDDDVSMMLHLQGALKTHWQNRPLEKFKPLKKLSLKHKLSGRLSDPSSPCSSSSKDKHKLSNSLIATVRLSHHKMRQDRLQHRQQLDSLLSASKLCKERVRGLAYGPYDRGHSRKRPRDRSLDRTDPSSKLFPDTCSPCSSNSLHTPTHSPLLRQLSTSSESSAPFALNSQSAISTPPIRRRRGESSFDINNIVIPMSVAATTRVEKLQYKEILTPSWREVNVCARPIAEEDDAVEVEDLSDVAFSQLHQLCEDQERSRWSWTASAMAKRRGSRSYKSLDGRTTPLLGGTNPSTPQPSSPDTAHFHSLQDYGPMGSPCSPASPDLPPHRLQPSEDTRCSTPDCSYEELVPQPVLPWESRTFPLEYDPATEPLDPSSLTPERPGRAPRRLSISKPENGPASPDPAPGPAPSTDEGWMQKAPVAPRAAQW